MKFTTFYKRWEDKLGTPFEKYGALVSRYPWHVLIACVTINCLLGIGMLRMESETDTETLYTPQNSQSKADRAVVRSIFTVDKSGSNFYSKSTTEANMYAGIIIIPKDGSSILTTTYVDEIERINNYINTTIKVTSDGSTFSLADVCALRSGSCVVEGDFVFSTAFRSAMASNTINYPLFNLEYISGNFGVAQSSGGYLTSAKMVRLIFYLRQDTATAASRSGKWERKYIEMFKTFSSSLVDVAYSTSTSLDDELLNSMSGDILYLFSFTMVLMFAYAGLATFGGDCVSDRQNLGRASVVAIGIAILGAFGLVSAAGVKFVSILGMLPFLVIGIGLDDMFILMSCLADCPVTMTVEEKLKETMKTGGVAITITSITDFLAFVIGASASFISVRNFCLYAGVAVLFCYINQLTFFVPCMAINERRMARSYHCGTCRKIESRDKLRASGKSKCHVFCCGGQILEKRKENESPLERYPKLFFQRIVQYLPGKITIAVIFIGYLVATVHGITNFKRGLLFSDLVTEDSYFYTYSKLIEGHFTFEIPIGFTITSTQTYSDATVQSRVSDLLSNARADADINPSVTFDWLTDYKSSGYYSAASETSFIAGLKTFLTSRPDHANDVVINSAETKIVGARFSVLTNDLPDSERRGNMMLRMRKVADNSPLPVVCFSAPFIFFDQYASVFSITLTTVGVAIAAIFLVTLVFMPHPLLVACVTGTMVMICAGMFGFMHYWDLTLNPITMIDIVLSIGFSVDFSAHICHAYITVDGTSRQDRVNKALDRAGGPIINAALSSIVGISVLAFTPLYIFKSFFKLIFLVNVFGLAHALLLLPLIFTLVGPITEVKVTPIPRITNVNASTIRMTSEQRTDEKVHKKGETDLDNGEVVHSRVKPHISELDNGEDLSMPIPNVPDVTHL